MNSKEADTKEKDLKEADTKEEDLGEVDLEEEDIKEVDLKEEDGVEERKEIGVRGGEASTTCIEKRAASTHFTRQRANES